MSKSQKSQSADSSNRQVERIVRHLPGQDTRVETGKVQFGDDWSGVFIRGDNAQYYSNVLRKILKNKIDDPMTEVTLNDLIKLIVQLGHY